MQLLHSKIPYTVYAENSILFFYQCSTLIKQIYSANIPDVNTELSRSLGCASLKGLCHEMNIFLNAYNNKLVLSVLALYNFLFLS